MSNNTSFAVGVRIDGNSAGLLRSAKEAREALKTLGVQSTKDAQLAQREFARMTAARQALGIRSEREIQREIVRTQAAYGRLARSGAVSWEEQRRAARAMREEVTRLTNEMGRLTRQQRLMRAGRIGVGAAVGIGTATALAVPPVKRALDYDLRLAYMANTAFAERNTAGRSAGKAELDAIIRDAVRYGGGTRDTAAETADELFGSGTFKVSDIKAILREAQLAGTANNAEPTAFARMAITANQTLGIPADRMGRIFGIGTYAGQQGGFEIRDMAKWLPQQMAAAKTAGMSGEAAFAKLAALNQAAVVTAGTRDEAGNNVVNLLAKLASMDTNKDFQKAGVNLPKNLAEGRLRGLDALEVLGNTLNAQLAKNGNYQQIQKQLAAAKDGSERQSALAAVSDIAQGTVIGRFFQDRQALMALYGYMNGRDRVNAIAAGSMQNTDAAQRNMELIRQAPAFQWQQAAQAREMALQSSIDKFAPALGGMGEKLSDLMLKYPGYTTAIITATGALTALATSAGVLALLALAGGKSAPKLPGGMSPPSGPSGSGAGTGFGRLFGGAGRALGTFARAAGPLALLETLTGPSDEDIATLRRMDAEARAAQGDSLRGKGYKDPRILGDAPTPNLSQRLGLPADQPYMPAAPVGGEILLKIITPPGMQVEAETRPSNQRIPFRVDTGRSNPEMR